jgi:[acyl-carrier-protein] S-malonyltransferase
VSGPPRTAVVLPGESGVRAGSLDPWLGDPAARDVVDEVSALVGRDVAEWWRDPLNLDDRAAADLAVVVTGIAGYRSLVGTGLRPIVVAGHGVGEHAALVAAGALPLDQVVELVHWQAELLSLSPRPSCAGLAAVRGPGAGEVAAAVVARIGATGPLAVAFADSPVQVVLTGGRDELARAAEAVVGAGLRFVRLPGRAPCHGPLVREVADRLSPALTDLDWSTPDVPVVPTVDARPTRDPAVLARCLRDHLTSPVRWWEASRALARAGATCVVEVGAVPVLGPLIRQAEPHLPVLLATGPGAPGPIEATAPALAGPVLTRGER